VALSRLGVGGVGRTYGTITAKAESLPGRPGDLYTRIAVGGIGQQYGTITAKSESIPIIERPGDIFTRIGIGGVGIHYTVTAKTETEIIIEELHTPGYYGTGLRRKKKEEDEILAFIMATYH